MSFIRRKAIEGIKVNDTFSISRTFTEHDMLQFADISGDYNPIHFDERFANAKKLNRRICHGLLVASLITEIGGQIGWFASEMSFHFRKPVYFGDTITCDFTITAIDERGHAKAEATFTNQDQVTVLEGAIKGIMPGAEEKHIMNAMVAEGDPTNKRK